MSLSHFSPMVCQPLRPHQWGDFKICKIKIKLNYIYPRCREAPKAVSSHPATPPAPPCTCRHPLFPLATPPNASWPPLPIPPKLCSQPGMQPKLGDLLIIGKQKLKGNSLKPKFKNVKCTRDFIPFLLYSYQYLLSLQVLFLWTGTGRKRAVRVSALKTSSFKQEIQVFICEKCTHECPNVGSLKKHIRQFRVWTLQPLEILRRTWSKKIKFLSVKSVKTNFVVYGM